MIIVHEDDGCLHVYEDLAAVVLAVEALDAEQCLLAVFDDEAQRHEIEWIKPNAQGWLGVSNGEYHLVPSGPPDPTALVQLIRKVGQVFPSSAGPAVQAVLNRHGG
jgi:hypothetical protein